VLLAYRGRRGAEAATEYLVLGGTATAMFLMGASLLYAPADRWRSRPSRARSVPPTRWPAPAVVLVILAFFLKAAIVHSTPGRPTPTKARRCRVTAYRAVLVKAGVLLAVCGCSQRQAGVGRWLELLVVLPLVRSSGQLGRNCASPSCRRMIATARSRHVGYLFYALRRPGGPAAGGGLLRARLRLAEPAASPRWPAAATTANATASTTEGPVPALAVARLMIGIAMLSRRIPPFPGFVAKS